MTELPGQLPLFTLDGADEWIQRHYADEGEYEGGCGCEYCANKRDLFRDRRVLKPEPES